MWKPGENPHRPERVNIKFKIDLKKKNPLTIAPKYQYQKKNTW